jgi:hypothetical protein
MVASISANHGSHFFKNLKRGDNHPTKNSNPSCTAIIHGLLEKYPTFGREKETGLLGALDT